MNKKFYDMGGVIVSYILNIIIIAYTLLYVISPVNKWHVLTDQFKYAEYDAIVYDCTQIYLEDILLKNTEIDSYLIRGMSLFEHTVKFGETAITVELIETVKADSLVSVKGIWIPEMLFESYDEDLILKKNAVLLSHSLAERLSVKLGDELFIEDKLYVLAGTYINDMMIDGIVLSEDTDKSYSSVYIKFKNPETGIDFIRNNYFTQGNLYAQYGDNFLQLAKPDEIDAQVCLYDIRELQLEQWSGIYRHNRIEAAAHTIIGLSLVLMLQIYSSHKRFEKKLKFHAIQISCGYRKLRLLLKYFVYALLQEFLIFAAAICLYTQVYAVTIRKMTFLDLYPAFLAVIFAAATVLALLSQYELRNSKLLQVLRMEG